MKYPNVNDHDQFRGAQYSSGHVGNALHQTRHLQSVAKLAASLMQQWSTAMISADAVSNCAIEPDERPKRTPDFAKLAQDACDAATALYCEFQEREWFVETPVPTTKAQPKEHDDGQKT